MLQDSVPAGSYNDPFLSSVCTLLITCSLNIDFAGERGMIVGPHSTKLPQSWDTGSDQPSVPASEDSDRLS